MSEIFCIISHEKEWLFNAYSKLYTYFNSRKRNSNCRIFFLIGRFRLLKSFLLIRLCELSIYLKLPIFGLNSILCDYNFLARLTRYYYSFEIYFVRTINFLNLALTHLIVGIDVNGNKF